MNTLVCIGFSEALSAPETAWSLLDAGFDVVVFGRRGRHSALQHSSRVTVVSVTPPEQDAVATLREIEAFLAERRPLAGRRNVIFPLDDAALWLCSRLNLPTGWISAGTKGDITDFALDKRIQVLQATTAGFNVPETTIANTAAEVQADRGNLPLVLRPAIAVSLCDGRLGKGRNWICATQTELDRALSQWKTAQPLLVQPFIRGNGEGVFGLATNKGILAWSAHRRVRMMNPHGSGSSACVPQPVPEDARTCVERLIEQTGWRGLFMVELLRDSSGTLFFVEFNGRPWGSMALSRRQGLEYPAWAAILALDPDNQIPAIEPKECTSNICRNAGRELMHLLFVLRGPESNALREWPSFWRAAFQVLAVRPGDSLYNWRRDDWKVFFADSWFTLRNNLKKRRRDK